MGVVDDLTREKQAAVGKFVACLVGVVDRPVDPVTEPELSRQPEGHGTDDQAIVVGAKQLDDFAVVVARALRFDGPLEPEAFAEVGGLHAENYTPPRRAVGNLSDHTLRPRGRAERSRVVRSRGWSLPRRLPIGRWHRS